MANRRHRRSIRLRGYDYTQPGAYFVTVCTHQKQPIFGDVADGTVQLNTFGQIVNTLWRRNAGASHRLALDAFTVMPNHLHAVIWILSGPDAAPSPSDADVALTMPPDAGDTVDLGRSVTCKSGSLGAIVGSLKSVVTRRIHDVQHTREGIIWQRNYYERIVRTESELARIRGYILANPARWAEDRFNEPMDF